MNHDAFCSVRQARLKRTNPVGPPFYEGPEEWGGLWASLGVSVLQGEIESPLPGGAQGR